MKTILLTGGSGRIGRCLRYALRDEYRMVLFNRERLGAGVEDAREVGHDAPGARLVRIGQGAPRHASPDAHQIRLLFAAVSRR